jgi:hypothetical protein
VEEKPIQQSKASSKQKQAKMSVEDLGKLCKAKFLHYISEGEKSFTHVKEILTSGQNTKTEIFHGLLLKIYDDSVINQDLLFEKFPLYFIDLCT